MDKKKRDSHLRNAFRKVWRWTDERRDCLKATKCYACKLGKKKLFADHVDPAVDPKKGWEGWDVYYERMFEGKLQPLCAKCHNAKSRVENQERRRRKNERKN